MTQTNYGSAAPFFFYSSVLVATTLPSQILMRSNWFVCHRPPLGGALVSPGFTVPQNSEVGTRLEFFGPTEEPKWRRREGRGSRPGSHLVFSERSSGWGDATGTSPLLLFNQRQMLPIPLYSFLCQRVFKIARGCYPGHPDARLNFVQQGSEKVHFSRGEDFFFSLQCLMLSSALKNMIYFFQALHQRRPQEEQIFRRVIAWLADLLWFFLSRSLAFLLPSPPLLKPHSSFKCPTFHP